MTKSLALFYGTTMFLQFFIVFTIGHMGGLLFRHMDVEFYLSADQVFASLIAALGFTSIFIFFSPVFGDIVLLKKIIFRLSTGNLILGCLIPFLIYEYMASSHSNQIVNFYFWFLLIFNLILIMGTYLTILISKGRIS